MTVALLGTDISWTDDDFQVQAGDYQLVSGIENLRRAVLRRLLTRPGEFRMRPTYGLGLQTWVKLQASSANQDALRAAILEQLAQEPRIASVDVLTLDFSVPEQLTITLSMTAISGQTVPLTATIGVA